MFTLQDFLDRALLLNIDDEYLDAQHVYFYANGKVYMYLYNFLLSIDDLGDAVIEIPEGVCRVYIDISDIADVVNNISFKLIFPSTLEYFGIKKKNERVNSIAIENDGTYKRYLSAFTYITFDFTRCNLLNKITKNSFYRFYLNELYLPDTLVTIENNAFQGCHINHIIGKGVCSLGLSAFQGAVIEELVLGDRLSIQQKSLALGSILNKFIIKDIVYMEYLAFDNIEELYLPYNLESIAIRYINAIDELRDELLNNKSNITYCCSCIKDFRTTILTSLDSTRYDMEIAINNYLRSDINDNSNESEDLVSVTLNLFFSRGYTKVYFYNQQNSSINIEGRNYEQVETYEKIELYVER